MLPAHEQDTASTIDAFLSLSNEEQFASLMAEAPPPIVQAPQEQDEDECSSDAEAELL